MAGFSAQSAIDSFRSPSASSSSTMLRSPGWRTLSLPVCRGQRPSRLARLFRRPTPSRPTSDCATPRRPARIQTILGAKVWSMMPPRSSPAICGRGDGHRQFSLGQPSSAFYGWSWRSRAWFARRFVMRWVQGRLDDPPVQITISLSHSVRRLSSGGTAPCFGRARGGRGGNLSGLALPAHRQRAHPVASVTFWEMAAFLLNGFIFIVIGLQLPGILQALRGNRFAPMT